MGEADCYSGPIIRCDEYRLTTTYSDRGGFTVGMDVDDDLDATAVRRLAADLTTLADKYAEGIQA